MVISLFQIIILGLVQGATEMLPISSSTHVIVAEKLMGIDPSTPEATFMLVMLHAGSMFAILAYFWRTWKENYGKDQQSLLRILKMAALATLITGVLALSIQSVIERQFLRGVGSGQIEELLGNFRLVGCGLAAVGILIIVSGAARPREGNPKDVDARAVAAMGFMQGLSLVFRGFSRSGSTISAGLLAGSGKNQTEEFSFALGLIVTPFVIARETMRLASRHGANVQPQDLFHLAIPGLMGMGCSFIGAMAALIILSRWLVKGKWRYFGFYCLAAAATVFVLAARGR